MTYSVSNQVLSHKQDSVVKTAKKEEVPTVMVIAAARGYHIDRNPDAMPPVGSMIDPTGGMASRRAKLQVRRSGRYAMSQKKRQLYSCHLTTFASDSSGFRQSPLAPNQRYTDVQETVVDNARGSISVRRAT